MERHISGRFWAVCASAFLAVSGVTGCGEDTLTIQQPSGETENTGPGEGELEVPTPVIETDAGDLVDHDENNDDWVDQVDEDEEGEDDKASCPKFCTEGEFTCIGGSLYECGKGTYGSKECSKMWLLKENCSDKNMYCDSAAHSCAACTETCADNSMKCAGNDLMQCVSDGRGCASWVVSKTCGANEICDRVTLSCASTGAQCVDACTLGGKRCNGRIVQECVRSSMGCTVWQTNKTCSSEQVCDSGTTECKAIADSTQKFSIVLIPDPQNYTRSTSVGYSSSDKENNIYYKEMKWIVDNKQAKNVQFVLHMGDITEKNALGHWNVSKRAQDLLDNNNIPNSISTGNHDYKHTEYSGDNKFGRRELTKFGDYYNEARYAGKSWFRGFYNTGNMYATFSVGRINFLVIALEYAPRKDSLCWADNLVRQYPNHRVIVTTHGYLTRGATANATGKYAGNDTYVEFGAGGQQVFDEFVRRHPNIIMVAGGHVFGSEHRERQGLNKNKIQEILSDYQGELPSECKHATDAGNGWLQIIEIDPTKTTNNAESYVVKVNGGKENFQCSSGDHKYYEKEPEGMHHQWTFTLDLTGSSASSSTYTTGGSNAFDVRDINADTKGIQASPDIAVNRSTGDFVAVWEDDSSAEDGILGSGEDCDQDCKDSLGAERGRGNRDIKARIFCASGCSSIPEFTVNKKTKGDQLNPDVAINKYGNFVVVWQNDKSGIGNYQVYARGFRSTGQGDLFDQHSAEADKQESVVVNTVASGQQTMPAVALAHSGKFVVAWHDKRKSSKPSQIYIRGLDTNDMTCAVVDDCKSGSSYVGKAFFEQKNVLDSADADKGNATEPDIAMDKNGNFVVVWADDQDGNGKYTIKARRFKADGSANGKVFTVAAPSSSSSYRKPSIGMDKNGNFAVAWVDSSNNKVMTAHFTSSATTPQYGPASVSKYTDKSGKVSVCLDNNSTAHYAWHADSKKYTDVILSRSFKFGTNKGDATIGDIKVVNGHSSTGNRSMPDIGCTGAGATYHVWENSVIYKDQENASKEEKAARQEIYGRGYDAE